MGLTEAVIEILSKSKAPMTPQEIRDQIKDIYPHLYRTESHARGVEKGQVSDFDHALLAQIYTSVGTGARFDRDKTTRPMQVALIADDNILEEAPEATAENYDRDLGIVYILGTGTYTENNKRILKVGHTTRGLDSRIAQLYTTGAPFRFEVIKSYEVKNYVELEQAMHRLFAPYRLNHAREFFTEDVLVVADKIVEIHQQIQNDA